MDRNHLLLYLSTASCCIIGGFAYLNQSSKVENPSAPIVSGSVASTSDLAVMDWAKAFDEVHDAASLEKLARSCVGLTSGELSKLAAAFENRFEEEPEGTLALLTGVTDQLVTDGLHHDAVSLTDLLLNRPEVPPLERKIHLQWAAADPEGALELLGDFAATGRDYNHQLSLLASISQVERPELFPELLDWARGRSAEHPNLLGTVVEKMVTHLTPDRTAEVGQLLKSELAQGQVSAALFPYVKKHSPEDRTQTLAWIKELPTNDFGLKAQVYGTLIQTIAVENQEEALELLTADNFLTNYYPGEREGVTDEAGEWTPSAQLFFDVALESYINGAMFHDLAGAKKSAESFFDPLRRERYATLFAQNSMPADRQHDCDHCNSNTPHQH